MPEVVEAEIVVLGVPATITAEVVSANVDADSVPVAIVRQS
jgi:hypothetical protein